MNKELNEKYHRLNNQITDKEKTLESLKRQIKKTEKDLIKIKDDIELQSYGLYEPQYKFINSTQYKEELDKIRQQQKGMIKNKNAATCRTEWQIDGSKSKGKAFSNQQIKQIIRSFNTECDAIISKVTYSNIENSKKRIEKSYQQLNKMNERNTISISYRYKELKLDELQLAFEYEQKKQEEKEMLREAREREREEKKLQKELDKEKNKYNRENDKLKTEIEKATDELKKANEKEKAKLEAEIAKLKQTLEDNEKQIENIDLRKTKTGAGYVYIISNRGSFGEDVFKIGVTRRDNPDERVRELSSASVPFRYDSHAYIFSKDAYKLESELHNRFDKNRVNKVNRRKEFFNISIDDVRKIVDENKANLLKDKEDLIISYAGIAVNLIVAFLVFALNYFYSINNDYVTLFIAQFISLNLVEAINKSPNKNSNSICFLINNHYYIKTFNNVEKRDAEYNKLKELLCKF